MKRVVQRNESGEWVPVDEFTPVYLLRWKVISADQGSVYLDRLDDYGAMRASVGDEIKISLSLYELLKMVERMDVRLEEVPEVENGTGRP